MHSEDLGCAEGFGESTNCPNHPTPGLPAPHAVGETAPAAPMFDDADVFVTGTPGSVVIIGPRTSTGGAVVRPLALRPGARRPGRPRTSARSGARHPRARTRPASLVAGRVEPARPRSQAATDKPNRASPPKSPTESGPTPIDDLDGHYHASDLCADWQGHPPLFGARERHFGGAPLAEEASDVGRAFRDIVHR
jgi:hypothetical protein